MYKYILMRDKHEPSWWQIGFYCLKPCFLVEFLLFDVAKRKVIMFDC
jgi:hypothetical protein